MYPARISYMYNPPHLAVEALEMYYRIHTVILKALVAARHDDEHLRVYKTVSVLLQSVFCCSLSVFCCNMSVFCCSQSSAAVCQSSAAVC